MLLSLTLTHSFSHTHTDLPMHRHTHTDTHTGMCAHACYHCYALLHHPTHRMLISDCINSCNLAILFQVVASFDRIILSLLIVWGVGVSFWVAGSLTRAPQHSQFVPHF